MDIGDYVKWESTAGWKYGIVHSDEEVMPKFGGPPGSYPYVYRLIEFDGKIGSVAINMLIVIDQNEYITGKVMTV